MSSKVTIEKIEEKIGQLQKTFECPICLDVIKNPVSTRCDHKFCRHCILETIQHKPSAPCPLCKELFTKRSLQPLPRFTEIVDGVRALIAGFQKDTGVLFSPRHGTPIASSLTPVRHATTRNASNQPQVAAPLRQQESSHRGSHPKSNIRKARRKQVPVSQSIYEDDSVSPPTTGLITSHINISSGFPAQKKTSKKPLEDECDNLPTMAPLCTSQEQTMSETPANQQPVRKTGRKRKSREKTQSTAAKDHTHKQGLIAFFTTASESQLGGGGGGGAVEEITGNDVIDLDINGIYSRDKLSKKVQSGARNQNSKVKPFKRGQSGSISKVTPDEEHSDTERTKSSDSEHQAEKNNSTAPENIDPEVVCVKLRNEEISAEQAKLISVVQIRSDKPQCTRKSINTRKSARSMYTSSDEIFVNLDAESDADDTTGLVDLKEHTTKAIMKHAKDKELSAQKPQPAVHKPQPAVHKPQPAAHKPKPEAHKPKPEAHKPKPEAYKPQPTAHKPQPTTQKPQLAAQKSQPSVQKPQPTAHKPQPVIKPQPVAHKPQLEVCEPELEAEKICVVGGSGQVMARGQRVYTDEKAVFVEPGEVDDLDCEVWKQGSERGQLDKVEHWLDDMPESLSTVDSNFEGRSPLIPRHQLRRLTAPKQLNVSVVTSQVKKDDTIQDTVNVNGGDIVPSENNMGKVCEVDQSFSRPRIFKSRAAVSDVLSSPVRTGVMRQPGTPNSDDPYAFKASQRTPKVKGKRKSKVKGRRKRAKQGQAEMVDIEEEIITATKTDNGLTMNKPIEMKTNGMGNDQNKENVTKTDNGIDLTKPSKILRVDESVGQHDQLPTLEGRLKNDSAENSVMIKSSTFSRKRKSATQPVYSNKETLSLKHASQMLPAGFRTGNPVELDINLYDDEMIPDTVPKDIGISDAEKPDSDQSRNRKVSKRELEKSEMQKKHAAHTRAELESIVDDISQAEDFDLMMSQQFRDEQNMAREVQKKNTNNKGETPCGRNRKKKGGMLKKQTGKVAAMKVGKEEKVRHQMSAKQNMEQPETDEKIKEQDGDMQKVEQPDANENNVKQQEGDEQMVEQPMGGEQMVEDTRRSRITRSRRRDEPGGALIVSGTRSRTRSGLRQRGQPAADQNIFKNNDPNTIEYGIMGQVKDRHDDKKEYDQAEKKNMKVHPNESAIVENETIPDTGCNNEELRKYEANVLQAIDVPICVEETEEDLQGNVSILQLEETGEIVLVTVEEKADSVENHQFMPSHDQITMIDESVDNIADAPQSKELNVQNKSKYHQKNHVADKSEVPLFPKDFSRKISAFVDKTLIPVEETDQQQKCLQKTPAKEWENMKNMTEELAPDIKKKKLKFMDEGGVSKKRKLKKKIGVQAPHDEGLSDSNDTDELHITPANSDYELPVMEMQPLEIKEKLSQLSEKLMTDKNDEPTQAYGDTPVPKLTDTMENQSDVIPPSVKPTDRPTRSYHHTSIKRAAQTEEEHSRSPDVLQTSNQKQNVEYLSIDIKQPFVKDGNVVGGIHRSVEDGPLASTKALKPCRETEIPNKEKDTFSVDNNDSQEDMVKSHKEVHYKEVEKSTIEAEKSLKVVQDAQQLVKVSSIKSSIEGGFDASVIPDTGVIPDSLAQLSLSKECSLTKPVDIAPLGEIPLEEHHLESGPPEEDKLGSEVPAKAVLACEASEKADLASEYLGVCSGALFSEPSLERRSGRKTFSLEATSPFKPKVSANGLESLDMVVLEAAELLAGNMDHEELGAVDPQDSEDDKYVKIDNFTKPKSLFRRKLRQRASNQSTLDSEFPRSTQDSVISDTQNTAVSATSVTSDDLGQPETKRTDLLKKSKRRKFRQVSPHGDDAIATVAGGIAAAIVKENSARSNFEEKKPEIIHVSVDSVDSTENSVSLLKTTKTTDRTGVGKKPDKKTHSQGDSNMLKRGKAARNVIQLDSSSDDEVPTETGSKQRVKKTPQGKKKHKETPHKEVPHKETPHKETPHKETPHKETPHKETPHKEMPHKETRRGSESGEVADYVDSDDVSTSSDEMLITNRHQMSTEHDSDDDVLVVQEELSCAGDDGGDGVGESDGDIDIDGDDDDDDDGDVDGDGDGDGDGVGESDDDGDVDVDSDVVDGDDEPPSPPKSTVGKLKFRKRLSASKPLPQPTTEMTKMFDTKGHHLCLDSDDSETQDAQEVKISNNRPQLSDDCTAESLSSDEEVVPPTPSRKAKKVSPTAFTYLSKMSNSQAPTNSHVGKKPSSLQVSDTAGTKAVISNSRSASQKKGVARCEVSSGSDSEEDIAASKRSRRRTQLVVNSDSDDQEDNGTTSGKNMNLTSSSAVSSQSEVPTTQYQEHLEIDVENIQNEIRRLEAELMNQSDTIATEHGRRRDTVCSEHDHKDKDTDNEAHSHRGAEQYRSQPKPSANKTKSSGGKIMRVLDDDIYDDECDSSPPVDKQTPDDNEVMRDYNEKLNDCEIVSGYNETGHESEVETREDGSDVDLLSSPDQCNEVDEIPESDLENDLFNSPGSSLPQILASSPHNGRQQCPASFQGTLDDICEPHTEEETRAGAGDVDIVQESGVKTLDATPNKILIGSQGALEGQRSFQEQLHQARSSQNPSQRSMSSQNSSQRSRLSQGPSQRSRSSQDPPESPRSPSPPPPIQKQKLKSPDDIILPPTLKRARMLVDLNHEEEGRSSPVEKTSHSQGSTRSANKLRIKKMCVKETREDELPIMIGESIPPEGSTSQSSNELNSSKKRKRGRPVSNRDTSDETSKKTCLRVIDTGDDGRNDAVDCRVVSRNIDEDSGISHRGGPLKSHDLDMSSNQNQAGRSPVPRRSVLSNLSSNQSPAGCDVNSEFDFPQRPDWCFAASGISKTLHKPHIDRLIGLLGASFSKSVTEDTTHVLVKPASLGSRRCQRTLKYFQAICHGKWLVSVDWVINSVNKNRLLPMETYEIVGDTVEQDEHFGPERSRLSCNDLLKAYQICCIGQFQDLSKDNLRELIEGCGGDVIKHPTQFTSHEAITKIVLLEAEQADKMPNLHKLREAYNCKTVPKEWLLDSIGTYSLKDILLYMEDKTNLN